MVLFYHQCFEVTGIINENVIETMWVYIYNFNYTSKILHMCILKEPLWESRWAERLSVDDPVPLAEAYWMVEDSGTQDRWVVTVLRGKSKVRW